MAHVSSVFALGIVLATTSTTAVKSPAPGGAPAAAAAAAAAGSAQVKKYCIKVEAFTGSRISKSECKSKADWAREGVDVDNPGKE
jgi:hypothetical protein